MRKAFILATRQRDAVCRFRLAAAPAGPDPFYVPGRTLTRRRRPSRCRPGALVRKYVSLATVIMRLSALMAIEQLATLCESGCSTMHYQAANFVSDSWLARGVN